MRKIKDFFKKIISLLSPFKSSTGEGYNSDIKLSVKNSLIALLIFSLYITLFQFVVQGFNWWYFCGPVFLNFLVIFLVCCFLYFTTGKFSWTFSISTTVMSILLTINHYKIRFRDEPLTTADFSLGKEAGNIVKGYSLVPDITIIFILIVLVAVVAWSILKVRNKRPDIKVSVIALLLTVALSSVLYAAVYTNTNIYNSFHSHKVLYKKTGVAAAQGLVYSLINDISNTTYEVPEGYSTEKAIDTLKRYPDFQLSNNTPNVIAVMCEAYADVQEWENVSFSDDNNPYEYFNYLKTIGCYGKIFVPGFGGATAVTEFEFLTGNNTSAISTSMPTAYNSIITNDVFSITRIFKDMDYHTSAIHPGEPWFYNRQNVYPRMGFDTFASLKDLPKDIEKINGSYAMDYITSDMIINDYNNYLNNNSNKGYFNFTVTIQNHGPYSNKYMYYDTEYIPKSHAGLTEDEYYIINNYLGGVKDADTFMKTIYEYINTLDEPTVFIIFGDHLPYLDTEEQIYKKLGYNIDENTHQSHINKHTTDYLIVGNNAFMDNYTPVVNGKQETLISSNYLAIKLFEYMDMPLHPYFAFKKELMQYAPVLSASFNGYAGDTEVQLPEKFNELYKELKYLQYYNIREYKNTLKQ